MHEKWCSFAKSNWLFYPGLPGTSLKKASASKIVSVDQWAIHTSCLIQLDALPSKIFDFYLVLVAPRA